MSPQKTVFQFMLLLSLVFCVSSHQPQRNRVKLYVPFKNRVVHKHHLKRVPVPVPTVKHIPVVKPIPVYKTIEVPVYQPVQVHVPVYIPQYSHQKFSTPPQYLNSIWSGNRHTQWEDNTQWNDQSQSGYHQAYEPYQQTYTHSTPKFYSQEEFYPFSSHQTTHVQPLNSQEPADVQYSEYPTYDQWKGLYSTKMHQPANDKSDLFHPVDIQRDELPYTDYEIYERSTDLPHIKVNNHHSQEPSKEHATKLKIVEYQAQDDHNNDLSAHRNSKAVISQPEEEKKHVHYAMSAMPAIPKYQQGSDIFDQHIHDRDRKFYSMTDNVAIH